MNSAAKSNMLMMMMMMIRIKTDTYIDSKFHWCVERMKHKKEDSIILSER